MSTAVTALLALGATIYTAGPASAQQISSCTSSTASPAAVSVGNINAGDSFTVTGGGFAPNQQLSIGLAQPPVVLATVASNTNGDYQTIVTTPTTTPSGQNQIIVFGRGPNGTCHQSIALFSVNARPVPVAVQAPPVQVFQQQPVVQPVIVASPAPVVAAGPAPATPIRAPLVRTGSSTLTMGLAGAAILMLGGVLVLFGRPARRRMGVHTA